MAIAAQVPKLALVRVDVGGGLTDLGYTRNGCEIESARASIAVPSDRHGGDEGDEVDAQALPPIYTIRLSLTEFDKATFEIIESAVRSGTAGTFATADVGALYVGGSKSMRVLISTTDTAWIRNFPLCRPIEAVAYNLGTRFAEAQVSFKAFRNVSSGVIWNTSAS